MNNEFLPKTSRGDIFKSMMRRPDTAKLIKEALASPVGSTSRQKAQKVFSIMNKLHTSHDGMGGPGMMDARAMYSTPDMPMTKEPTTPKGMVIFHKIPSPKINFGGSNAARLKNDGAGGPGIYDGKGGLFDDLGSMVSTFTKPFTDYLSSGSNSTPAPNMSTVNGPVYAPPPSSSSYYPKLVSSPSPTINMSVAPKPTATTTNQSTPSTWQPGLLPQFGSWLSNTALPAVGSAIGTAGKAALSLGGAIPAAAQFVAQNVAELPFAAYRTLVGQDTARADQAGPGFVGMGDTWAAKQIAQLWPSLTQPKPPTPPTVASSPTSTTTPSAMFPSLGGMNTTTPQTSQGKAPSFYSALSGFTSPGTAQASSGSTPYSPGASASYSGGASSGYSGGASGSFIDRLVATESGGNYQAVGKVINNGGQNDGYAALGKYQIMPNLHFASIGLNADSEADVKKFLSTPALQDGLFTNIIGGLLSKYGGDEAKAAAAYFGGDRAAQAYGTPEGDKITDGNLTVNQYVAKVMGGSAGGNTPSTSFTSLQAAAKAAVDGGMSSPTTFALQQMTDPNNPVTQGMLYSQAEAANKNRIWDAFKLDSSKTAIEALQKEVTALPKDMTDYISARDQYIKQTDKAIDDYMESMKGMDMSNPATVQKTTSHLNYLYTLRGRQNQSYMGYLNDAVIQHETKLNNAITDYNSKLSSAEAELTSANAMTREKYNAYSQSLTELYTSIQDAPVRALQLSALKNQSLGAAGTGAVDQAAYDAKVGYFAQLKKLEDAHFVDTDGRAILGTNLVDQIARTMQGDPSIEQTHMIRAYEEGVQRYMSTPSEKDSSTGTGVTDDGKRKMAEEAIRNFAQLASVGMSSGNDAAVNQGVQSAISIGSNLSNSVGQNIQTVAPQIMQAVKGLAPGGWFFGMGRGTTPTLEQFTANIKKSTNNNPLADSIAKAVYAVFLRYTQESGSTPQGAVTAMLHNVNSTSDRSNPTPYTPEEFANIIGRMYAEDIIMSEFGIDPQISQIMQTRLYQ